LDKPKYPSSSYLTVSVTNNGHPEMFAHLQCIIHFLCAGAALFLLAFLHHVSVNTENPSMKPKLSPVYRRCLSQTVLSPKYHCCHPQDFWHFHPRFDLPRVQHRHWLQPQLDADCAHSAGANSGNGVDHATAEGKFCQ
jgi:hypothetical protein